MFGCFKPTMWDYRMDTGEVGGDLRQGHHEEAEKGIQQEGN